LNGNGKSRNILFGTYPRYSYLYSHERWALAKKRGNGEGSGYRRKDGLWVGQYKAQTPNGTKTKYIYSKTRKDAAEKLAKAIAERDSGVVYDIGSLTVSLSLNSSTVMYFVLVVSMRQLLFCHEFLSVRGLRGAL
jgi:hypothetical protein